MKPILVIGTSAPRRRAMAAHHLSTEYELVFCSPDIDEKSIRSSNAFELTSLISSAKMDAIVASIHADAGLSTQIAQRPGSMALSFDQVVVWQDEIREKPESEEENLRFLASYSNSSLDTVQTTVLHNFSTGKRWSAPNTTTTYYRDIPLEVVQKVVKKQVSRHAAGGFVVEDEDMMAFMIRIDPGTSEEVQGFSIGTIRKLIAMNVDESG